MPLEIQLINCKVKSKLKWTKHCVLSAADSKNNINEDASANDMIFTIKGNFSQQETIKNSQNFLAKDLKYQFIEMDIKPKVTI